MESVGSIGSRRRAAGNHYSAEEQALDQIAKEAESRLAARRQARAEAREIRMKELEKQQKEMEENADRQFSSDCGNDSNLKIPTNKTIVASGSQPPSGVGRPVTNNSSGSFQQPGRRGSEDVGEDFSGQPTTLRDLRNELKELEEKFRKAMVQNAQSDNEKASLVYQVEMFKDRIEDMEEAHALLQKEHKEKHRECEEAKREAVRIQQELNYHRYLLEERDRMIQEHGLVIAGEGEDEDSDDSKNKTSKTPLKALVSSEVAALLNNAGEGSLDARVRRLVEDKNELSDQLRRVKLDLEEERSKCILRDKNLSVSSPTSPNGPGFINDLTDLPREGPSKQINEYKVKLQKADQEIATLQASVARLETQVTRYRTAAETSEKAEDELKAEKRKLQRELRETQTKLEELETSHNHLERRLDKLKTAKSALLKDI